MGGDPGSAVAAASMRPSRRVRGYSLVVAAAATAAVVSLALLVAPVSTRVSESGSATAGNGEPAVEHHERRVTRETLVASQGPGALAIVTGPLLALTVAPLAAARRRPAAVATRAVSTVLLFTGVALGALSFGILYLPAAVLMLLAAILAAEAPRSPTGQRPNLTAPATDAPASPASDSRDRAAARSLTRRHRLVIAGAAALAGRELVAAAGAAGWNGAEALTQQWWVWLPLWAAGTAAYMAWSWRAAANVRLLAGEPRCPPALAAVSWAVPLANLVVPFLAVREAGRSGDAPPVRGLGWWWAAVVAWRLDAWVAAVLWQGWPAWAGGLLGITAAAATVVALGAVTRRHQRLLAGDQR